MAELQDRDIDVLLERRWVPMTACAVIGAEDPETITRLLDLYLMPCGLDDDLVRTMQTSGDNMKPAQAIAALVLAVGLFAGCGDDDAVSDGPTASPVPTSTTTSATPTSGVPALEQPAIWPAPGVVFDTPQAAAADFMSNVLGVPPELGEFRQGDSRSGEIEVLPPAESAGSGAVRSLLVLRQLGPDNGWFVLAAINDHNTITSPESMTEVAAGPLLVSGDGRGFEGLVVVEAYVAGDAGGRLDQQTAQGGSTENTEPFSVTVDLAGVESGQTVLLLVRGGVGLETDPGEFSAIPVIIG